MRYPNGHEVGVDSFAIHTLAESIVVTGSAAWILNPLSYFGLYPVSYPSAGPFLIASVGSTAGIEMEGGILLTSHLLAVLGILTPYLMAREFRRTGTFPLFVAFVYAFAPRFLAFSLWQASTRNIFMALLPIFVWALLRFCRQRSTKNLVAVLVGIVILAASHHLVILAVVMAAALLFSIVMLKGYQVLRRVRPGLIMKGTRLGVTRWVGLSAALAVGLGFVLGTSVLSQYNGAELANGDSLQVELFNMGVSITRSVGLGAPIVIIVPFYCPSTRSPDLPESFAVAGLVALVPTLLFRDYTGFYVLPFLSVFAGYGLFGATTRLHSRKRLLRSLGIGVALAILVTSGTILDYEIAQNPPMSITSYTAATYVGSVSGGATIVCNEAVTCSRIAAIGRLRILPPAAGSANDPSPEVLVFGFYDRRELIQRVVRAPSQDLRFDSTLLWLVVDIDPVQDYVAIVQSPMNGIPVSLSGRYAPVYYFETASGSGVFYGNDGRSYRSTLSDSLHASGYALYADGAETLWWV